MAVLKFAPARGKKQPAIEIEDERVPQLRAKLGITENAGDTIMMHGREAVRKFQAAPTQADRRSR